MVPKEILCCFWFLLCLESNVQLQVGRCLENDVCITYAFPCDTAFRAIASQHLNLSFFDWPQDLIKKSKTFSWQSCWLPWRPYTKLGHFDPLAWMNHESLRTILPVQFNGIVCCVLLPMTMMTWSGIVMPWFKNYVANANFEFVAVTLWDFLALMMQCEGRGTKYWQKGADVSFLFVCT